MVSADLDLSFSSKAPPSTFEQVIYGFLLSINFDRQVSELLLDIFELTNHAHNLRAQILTGTKESGRAEAPEKHRHRSVRINGCKRVIFIEKGSQCVCQSVLQVLWVCIVETWFRDDLPTIGLAPSRKCFTNAASLCQSSMFGFGRPSNRLPFVSYFHFYEIVRSFKDMLQCTRIYWSLKKV